MRIKLHNLTTFIVKKEEDGENITFQMSKLDFGNGWVELVLWEGIEKVSINVGHDRICVDRYELREGRLESIL